MFSYLGIFIKVEDIVQVTFPNKLACWPHILINKHVPENITHSQAGFLTGKFANFTQCYLDIQTILFKQIKLIYEGLLLKILHVHSCHF